jgi:hypothetical protein
VSSPRLILRNARFSDPYRERLGWRVVFYVGVDRSSSVSGFPLV